MAGHQPSSPESPVSQKYRTAMRTGLTLVELLVVIAIIGLLVCMMLPAVRTAREPARRNQCLSQLRQIGLALANYEDARGGLPAAYIVDAYGDRLHSWRSQILVNLDGQQLYESIDFSKAWDAVENEIPAKTEFANYQCPSSPEPRILTGYFAIVTPESAFRPTEQSRLADMSDGLARTILATEVRSEYAVPWMSPTDFDETTVIKYRGSRHDRVFGTIFADGHAEMMRDDVTPEAFQSLISIVSDDVQIPERAMRRANND
jgi:prepilin-type N-terminal cleavage/methylation domain-containing protein